LAQKCLLIRVTETQEGHWAVPACPGAIVGGGADMESKQITKTLRPTPSLSINAPVRGRPYWGRAKGSESHRPLPGVTCSKNGDLAGLPNAYDLWSWAWEIPMPKEQVTKGRRPRTTESNINWTDASGASLASPPTVNLDTEIIDLLADLLVAEVVVAKKSAS
jgi:hypothetical protein